MIIFRWVLYIVSIPISFLFGMMLLVSLLLLLELAGYSNVGEDPLAAVVFSISRPDKLMACGPIIQTCRYGVT